MRTATARRPKSSPRRESTTIERAPAFSERAVAASRSNNTWSASSVAALACMRALLAGTDKHERLGFSSRGISPGLEGDPSADHGQHDLRREQSFVIQPKRVRRQYH